MKRTTGVLLISIMATFAYADEPQSFSIVKTNEVGDKASVHITQAKYSPPPEAAPDDGSMWGIDGGFPYTIIKEFKILINGNEVWVPKKIYSDICCINNVSLEGAGRGFVLRITGGDAAGSYYAEYNLANGKLFERTVRMGEFPEAVWEKTIFVNHHFADQ